MAKINMAKINMAVAWQNIARKMPMAIRFEKLFAL